MFNLLKCVAYYFFFRSGSGSQYEYEFGEGILTLKKAPYEQTGNEVTIK